MVARIKTREITVKTVHFILSIIFILVAAPIEAKTIDAEPLDQVVAIINDDVITQSELDKQAHLIKKRLTEKETTLPEQGLLDKQILNQLIEKKLQLQTAHRAGITIDDNTLDQAMEDIAKKNDFTLTQLRKAVESDGVNFDDFRNDIREQIAIERFIAREIANRITITQQEVAKYMNSAGYDQEHIKEYHLQDILIALPEIPSSEDLQKAKKLANTIVEQLNAGKKFETLAIANSNGQSALTGGDLGWRRIEEIPSTFVNDAQIMKVGDIKGPIRADNGYHIIKLLESRGNVQRHHITETRVQHILLKTTLLKGDEVVKAELLTLKKQIENGKDFSAMAEKHSQDPGSAVHGGNLNWVKPGQLVPQFENTMNKLAINELSAPVKSQFGWHVIRVLERRDLDDTEEYEKQKIKKLIYQRHYEEEVQNWIKRMRDASYIETTLPS